MYQVVIDTNVLVAALLSNLGASHRLLRLLGDHRWRINLSVPLVLEYAQTLKRVCMGGPLSGSDIDDVLRFLCANAKRASSSSDLDQPFGAPGPRICADAQACLHGGTSER